MEEVAEGKDFSFPQQEELTLKFWNEIKAFEEQLRLTEGKPEYIFYDGPPFATGLPHYGHILAGTIKDIVTRYASCTGHHVSRRFGWDCHGLPVEYEIDKKLGIKSRDDVLKMGIDKYNEECRSIVMRYNFFAASFSVHDGMEGIARMMVQTPSARCAEIVLGSSTLHRYSKEWEKTVKRLGRWIDFENDYKTLDPTFMESVWWVFKQLFEKRLVYKGFKVMPFSTACSTPLSNFEAGLNYKDVSDPAVMVGFPVIGDADGTSLVAWTTTPWTLPSNLALCVNPDLTYVKVRDPLRNKVYIVAEARLSSLPGAIPKLKKGAKKDDKPEGGFDVLAKMNGKDLVGLKYEPLFSYFAARHQAFRVVSDSYVTDDSGTGVVHQAPAFGEDDYRVCIAHGIVEKGEGVPCPVDLSGRFTAVVADFVGQHVKEADKGIVAMVKAKGRLVDVQAIMHSYPFCWRSDTPLIYRAVPSWFVAVESFRDRLLVNNQVVCTVGKDQAAFLHVLEGVRIFKTDVQPHKHFIESISKQTYWVPAYVKEKRFHNWLENARDWAISRSRFWGTPLPIWTSEDGLEVVVIGSIAELEELSGAKVTDLHRHFIDHLTIPSRQGKGQLHRVDEVFDCWFESGSMPYAQLHYPFDNQKVFEQGFPADFVAEGLDQTRGWFYTLMVLSTALFDKPAFKNLVCNGLVLAADGKKMSKRLKNYPVKRNSICTGVVARAPFQPLPPNNLPASGYNVSGLSINASPGESLLTALHTMAVQDPNEVLSKYGADALRLYLINSPVVRAETLRFREEGVFAVVKDVFLPWYNAYRFLVQNVRRLQGMDGDKAGAFGLAGIDVNNADNVLDRWILASARTLTTFVRTEMEAYRLYTVVPHLVKFLDNLTNIYVRYNRKRLKGSKGPDDCSMALAALFNVLITVCKVMAPFTPFLTESMYQNLRKALPSGSPASVHFCEFPQAAAAQEGDARIQQSVDRMQRVIELGRTIRDRHNKPLKFPLRELIVVHSDREFLDDIEGTLHEYVTAELNVRQLTTCADATRYCTLRAEPNFAALAPRLGKAVAAAAAAIKALTPEAIQQYDREGNLVVEGHKLEAGDIRVVREFRAPEGTTADQVDANGDGEVLAVLSLVVDKSLQDAGLARELVNRFQKLRKKAGLLASDVVELYYGLDDPAFIPSTSAVAGTTPSAHSNMVAANGTTNYVPAATSSSKDASSRGILERLVCANAAMLHESLGVTLLPLSAKPPHAVVIMSERQTVGSGAGSGGAEEGDPVSPSETFSFRAVIAAPAVAFNYHALLAAVNGNSILAEGLQIYLAARDHGKLRQDTEASGGVLRMRVDGYSVELRAGQHFFFSGAQAVAATADGQ